LRRVIVGTAGHIDHGKTKLVEALTGIDCDRWIEEKQRGITIDLGFAFLREDDFQIGFIDVPGHERFVHNALAGLGGIRLVLLVVAADEGIKPQTREHLDICRLLEIPGCLVALTKTDMVDEDVVELARMEVEELLATTAFANSRILAVSSKTGSGVETLRRELFDLARQHETPSDPQLPVRIPIDRAFHLKGLGVVVTGTLVSGQVHPGDTLHLLPGEKKARIRSVQVHGTQRQEAEAGERTALQLSGVTLEEVRRGLQLVSAGQFQSTHRLIGRLTLLEGAPKPLRGSTMVRFHLYSSEMLGRVRPLQGPLLPGRSGEVEIRLSQPVVAVRGDRFILRRPSPPTTLGGGEILDPQWHRHRASDLDQSLKAFSAGLPEALTQWIREAQEAGIDTATLTQRTGERRSVIEEALAKLESEQEVLAAVPAAGQETRWLTPDVVRRVKDRAQAVLRSYFKRQRLAEGMPKAEAIERFLPKRAADMAPVYLAWLQAEKVLVVSGGQVRLPGRSAELTGEESSLAQQIVRKFDSCGLQPPVPGEVCELLAAKPQIFDGVVQYLLKKGDLLRLPGGLLISAKTVGGVVDDLRQRDQEKISVGDFKSRFGLTRKWAIPILEYLDSAGVTKRIGDQRLIMGRPS
jgi:selenocysteine-specific elongation factor